MARLFVPPALLTGDRVELGDDAHRHLARVLRVRVGDPVVLFDGEGAEIDSEVIAIGPRTVTLALGERRRTPLPLAPITLLQAVPRGDRMDLLVQKTTELGVARIIPLITERSVVRPTAERARRWQTIAQEAARQSGRADLPQVTAPLPLAEALPLAASSPLRLALWEEERAHPLRHALATPSATALLIGPEGGLTPAEIAQARAAGFLTVTLGPRILRVETAAIVALALVQSATGALD